MARHRDASAVQERSPLSGEAVQGAAAVAPASPPSGARRIIPKTESTSPVSASAIRNDEILVVVSKVKDYIRSRSEMNTSSEIMPILSNVVRRLCDDAIDKARSEGRKTVLDRDF